MTTDQTDREALLEIRELLDRADRLEVEEHRLNSLNADSSTGDSPSQSPEEGKQIGYVEFLARLAGIGLEEQERRMGLAPQDGQVKPRSRPSISDVNCTLAEGVDCCGEVGAGTSGVALEAAKAEARKIGASEIVVLPYGPEIDCTPSQGSEP